MFWTRFICQNVFLLPDEIYLVVDFISVLKGFRISALWSTKTFLRMCLRFFAFLPFLYVQLCCRFFNWLIKDWEKKFVRQQEECIKRISSCEDNVSVVIAASKAEMHSTIQEKDQEIEKWIVKCRRLEEQGKVKLYILYLSSVLF